MADEHKASCGRALELVNKCIFKKDWPREIRDQLEVISMVLIEAADRKAGEGYRLIVEAEDFLLDIVADHYEIDAKSTTERRRLAREKIGLPVLY